jgi:uncharacterized membrane-anchored protein
MKINKLIVLVIPVLIMLGWLSMLQYKLTNGKEVRLKIAAYDPRDILSGHYMRYTIDFGTQLSCKDNSKNSCVCLSQKEGDKFHTAFLVEDCDQLRPTCNTMLKGDCSYQRFSTNIERYYIPEKYSNVLQTLPQNGSILVSLDTDGNGIVKEMFVKNETIIEYAEKKLSTN